ncbi:MAG: radical SAM protein [Thaumarchaeota archaeon]|nr:radical SAM protein [Nitrososphaerota archaeon]
MIDLVEEFEKKLEIASSLRDRLGEDAEAAERDPHSRRLPRPCGLTIHTGIGCKFGCLYCYIWDMGFRGEPRAYPLSGLQLAYAIASNPAVALGRNGTLLAYGSVTEPFMDVSKERSFEYLSAVAKLLGNPIQLSTKAYLSSEDVSRLKELVGYGSFLVTIISLSMSRLLEPNAPSPDRRFETIGNLRKAGFHTCLFLRPILPGIGLNEFREILEKAYGFGVCGVVLGSLRVTRGIIDRLRAAGYPGLGEILDRIPRNPSGGEQVTIRSSDLKQRVAEIAKDLGIEIYPSACAASIAAHGLGCWACRFGPCGDREAIPDFEPADLIELARRFKLKIHSLRIEEPKVFLKVDGDIRMVKRFKEFVKALIKRELVIG